MNASRLGGLIALVLAPALAQTYFPDVGKFTFQQGLDGDWLYIDYKYTNPGGWLRNDDAGAEVDWNLYDVVDNNINNGVYWNCKGYNNAPGGYVDCGILATPEPGDKGHAWGGGLRYANQIAPGRWYNMYMTLWPGLGYGDPGPNNDHTYAWNVVGQETMPCVQGSPPATCHSTCPNNDPICMFSARSKIIIRQDTHAPVQIPKPGVLMRQWDCTGIPEGEECKY